MNQRWLLVLLLSIVLACFVLLHFLFASNSLSLFNRDGSAPPLAHVPVLEPRLFGVYPPPPRVVWVFWVRGAVMSRTRQDSIAMMKKFMGVPIKFITEDDLPKYNVSWDPIHPFMMADPPILSGNHRVDYLRAYFMRHYGGGYHDIKPQRHDWNKYFDEFDKPGNVGLWMMGTEELFPGHIACETGYVARLGITPVNCVSVENEYKRLVSNGLYIHRPGTPMTVEWLAMITERIEQKRAQLLANPVPLKFAGRCCQKRVHEGWEKYPLEWGEMHGMAVHPLQLRWNAHIRKGIPRWEDGKPYL